MTHIVVNGEFVEQEELTIKVGARIRHRRIAGLTGKVVKHDAYRYPGGYRSVLPYIVQWDDLDQALAHFGIPFVDRMSAEEIEPA